MFRNNQSGFTMLEVIVTLAVLAGILTSAAPAYTEFVVKRDTTGAVEILSAYIENAKIEAIKRNRPVTVTFNNTYNGNKWCFGTEVGNTACNCIQTNPAASDFCDVDGVGTKLWYNQFNGAELDNVDTFDGGVKNFTFDPVRGLLTNRADAGGFDVVSSNGRYKVTVSMNGAGRIRQCSPSSYKLVGYKTCS